MDVLYRLFTALIWLCYTAKSKFLSDIRLNDLSSDGDETNIRQSLSATPAPSAPSSYNNAVPGTRKPNILIFITDDLGHADLSYSEGNLQTPTPNIDRLAWDGIILNRHYVNPICTPTRGAFMTGKDAFRIGLQTAAISDGEPWGLPLQFKIQPQYFKDLGYTTAAIGKWHLGTHTRQHFPGARGFDYSYWFHGGDINWFNATSGWITPVPNHGKALRENGKMVFSNITNNYYFPEQMTAKAEQVIHDFDPNKPWYLYFATPATHTAIDDYGPEQHTMARFQLRPPVRSFSDQFPERKKQLGIIQVLDEQFRRLVDALTYSGAINNTIIVFLADNGGALPVTAGFTHGSNHASNWPLRLGKGSLFDGGVRGLSFIWSPLLKRRGRVTNQLFHVSDWLPTLYEAAGGNGADLLNVSGISQWKSLTLGYNYGPRTELVNNIDTILKQYAMVYQDQYGGMYKLIGGNVFNNQFFGWDRTAGTSPGNEMKVWTPVSVDCTFPDGIEVNMCRPYQRDCLFDLLNDPCETNNIADSFPSMVKLLQQKLQTYNASSFPAQIKPFDPASNPDLHQGLWTPWLDTEILDKEPLTFQPFTPSNTL